MLRKYGANKKLDGRSMEVRTTVSVKLSVMLGVCVRVRQDTGKFCSPL